MQEVAPLDSQARIELNAKLESIIAQMKAQVKRLEEAKKISEAILNS